MSAPIRPFNFALPILVAALWSSAASAAVSPDPLDESVPGVRSFTVAEGLPDNTILSLLLDPQGHLWAGTQDGPAMWNGRAWSTPELPFEKRSRTVRAMLATRDGSLWFGTTGGGLWRLQNGSWTAIDDRSGLPSNQVECIYQTHGPAGDVLWVGTSKGLARFQGGSWQLVDSKSGLPSGAVHAILENKEGLWVGTDSGLAQQTPQGFILYTSPHPLPHASVNALLTTQGEDGAETLWVGTESGLASLEEKQWRNYKDLQGFQIGRVSSLAETVDPTGKKILWVGTNRGLARLRDGLWRLFDKEDGLPDSLVYSLITSPVAGHGSAIWIGTDGGLGRIFDFGWRSFPRGPAFLRGKISSILQSRDGSIWLASEHALARYTQGFAEIASPTNSVVTALGESLGMKETEGKPAVIAGTANGELAAFVEGRWRDLQLPADAENGIRAVVEQHSAGQPSSLWVARKNGLWRLSSGVWNVFDTGNGLQNSWVLSLASSGSDLWAGTYGGLSRYQAGAWKNYTTASSNLPGDVVGALLAEDDSKLWIATTTGTIRVDPKLAGQWKDLPRPEVNLAHAIVLQTALDGQDRVYLFNNKGIARISNNKVGSEKNSREFSVENFGVEDGLPAAECVYAGGMIDAKGRVWAATTKGLAVYDPGEEMSRAAPRNQAAAAVPFVFERAQVAGRAAPLLEGETLDPEDNTLSFEYARLGFHHDAETRYRTQLVGLEAQPGEWDQDYKKELTLPAGKYELRVWAQDHQGQIQGPISRHFQIRPHRWATWWAYTIYILLSSGAAWMVSHVRTRLLQARADALQLKVDERTAALSMANRELNSKHQALEESYQESDRIFRALSDALAGRTLDEKYKLEERIGQGGFGAVFRALDLRSGEKVAVKVFRPQAGNESVQALDRFRQEAESSSQLRHKNTVAVLGSGVTSDGVLYLVMELLEGRALDAEIAAAKRLSPARAVEITIEMLHALAEAHALGIIHRDIKPENVFLHRGTNGETVKLLDFGIARMEDPQANKASVTVTGQLIGTPVYMAPERLQNKPYDERSDVYSVGILLYEMLVGKPPFDSADGNIVSLILMHVTQFPRPPAELVSQIPRALSDAVMAALAKDPKERPTALGLADLLSLSTVDAVA